VTGLPPETEAPIASEAYRRFRRKLMTGLVCIYLLALLIVGLGLSNKSDVDLQTLLAGSGILMMVLIMSYSADLALHAYRRSEQRQLRYHKLYETSRETELKLSQSENRLRMVTDNLPVVIGYVDQEERITFANRTYQQLFDVPLDQVIGCKVIDVIGPKTYAISKAYIDGALRGEPACFERERQVNGRTVIDAVTYVPEMNGDKVSGFFLLVEDITERRLAEENRLLTSLVYDSTSEGMMILEADGAILNVNPAFSKLTGYGLEEVKGKHLSNMSSDRHKPEFFQEIRQSIGRTGQWQGEIWNCYRNGEPYLISIKFNTVYDQNGKALRRVALFSDITERKASEEKIWREANFDPLTGLPNRRMFHERLRLEMMKADRRGTPMGLIFLDLDHFKEVNDTLGHALGDVLLREAAQRLSMSVRGTDTVARLGGDEFTIILSELPDPGDVSRIAEDILKRMTAPFRLGENEAHISASIGITLYPEDGRGVETLLKNADQAMYTAKEQGRNRYNYFAPFMQEATHQRKQLAHEMRKALAGNQLRVVYQAIVKLDTGRIEQAEALMRWQHPERGLLAPREFLGIAEATGMIVPFGEWIFHQAAHQLKRLQALEGEHFQISVNKSALQFRDGAIHFNDWVEYLKQLELPRSSVIVEVTEQLLHDTGQFATEKLTGFRQSGIQVSLDDFGVGYSSLAFLKRLDIDYLKINPAFVTNLGTAAGDGAMCEAIILMAHKLGMKVIAEGIETEAQLAFLKRAGCDYGQGYLLSMPMNGEEFEASLAARQHACG
jgi:diguanylate cyclase (GGDEF)-like protein/PAS domain S-box-containing protein